MIREYEKRDRNKLIQMLRLIAQIHPDEDWRFNAIEILNSLNLIDQDFLENIFHSETDEDIFALIGDLMRYG
jgi:hypothetical protein